MKAYLIDPVKKSIDEVDYDGSLDGIYNLLNVRVIDAIEINEHRDAIFVDDEGLLYDPEEIMRRGFFAVDDPGNIIAGRGLVLGTDDEGDSCEPYTNINYVRERIFFPDVDEVPEPRMEIYPL